HELAHIGNRDTRLMVTVVTGVAMFSVIGEVLLRTTLRSTRGRSRGGGKAQLVILTAGVACLVFGILIAPIIRCALSRRREYQADATAAQITRNPDALARALQKISKNPFVSTMDGCSMMGSLCIAEPSHKQSLSATLAGVYATHPPVKNRVMALRQMVGRI
ncbi:MAG: M48 family metalloprotease, partial [Alphaproteobacteria bacterium]|nr:M48 family metalloprotease [Alphaproteobacteria bacterium]